MALQQVGLSDIDVICNYVSQTNNIDVYYNVRNWTIRCHDDI